MYFDIDATEPCTMHAMRVAVRNTVGDPINFEVWTAATSFGNEANAAAWTMHSTAAGTAGGTGNPSEIELSTPLDLPLGTTGIALVYNDGNSSYTNGNGSNEVHTSADGVLTITGNASSGSPFGGTLFQTRVWNGNLFYDVENAHCVTTTFADNNAGGVGGTIFFDLDAARPLTFSGLTTHFNGTIGASCGIEVYTRPGTHTGFTGSTTGWTLVAVDDGTATNGGEGTPTPINFAAPFSVGTGSWGVALVAVNANHEYTNGGGANELQGSPDGNLTLSLGSATNGAFSSSSPFNPRIWNGTLCYDGDFIGSNFCETVANSTGAPGVMSAVGSRSVATNNVQLRASSLPNNATAFFLTSQTDTVVMMPGTSVGNLCIAGPAIGRYVGPGQVQNSGADGAVALNIDLNQHPTPTGLIGVIPGESWNFQCWHRDSVGGAAVSNFTDALTILFE